MLLGDNDQIAKRMWPRHLDPDDPLSLENMMVNIAFPSQQAVQLLQVNKIERFLEQPEYRVRIQERAANLCRSILQRGNSPGAVDSHTKAILDSLETNEQLIIFQNLVSRMEVLRVCLMNGADAGYLFHLMKLF